MTIRQTRTAAATSARYWRGVAPSLSIEGKTERSGTRPRSAARPIDARAAAREIASRGYARLDGVYPEAIVRPLLRGVERLAASGWPPIFLALFDEFWLLPRRSGVPTVLRGVLGATCHQSPNVWVHLVPAQREAQGWPPHRDHAGPHRLTVWIPLTRAGVDDGCISILPRDRLPPRLAGLWRNIDRFSRGEVLGLLHAAQPLPADAGALVCWQSDLLHWGGRRASTGQPRVACSMEFTASPIDPAEVGMPSLTLDGPLPGFPDRLRLVASMILLYHRNDPGTSRHVPFARRVLSRGRLASGA
jgi:hypothetical protein